MAVFGVTPQKEEALAARMRRFHIREQDIRESFVRARGPGGQNVNKTSTCVYLKHIPTGIEVKCQRERSQAINRYLARMILANKLEARVLGKASEERARIEKIRRQKRKRSKRAKLKVLEAKRRQSEKKQFRAGVDVRNIT